MGKFLEKIFFNKDHNLLQKNIVDGNDLFENPVDIADNNIHLVAEVSKTNPYLNEPISIVYKLYWKPDLGITNPRELDAPRYANFWSNNIMHFTHFMCVDNVWKFSKYYSIFECSRCNMLTFK